MCVDVLSMIGERAWRVLVPCMFRCSEMNGRGPGIRTRLNDYAGMKGSDSAMPQLHATMRWEAEGLR